ncbi:MAG: hypothetical protein AB7N24_10905 [Dehalococcoidia bacterium]
MTQTALSAGRCTHHWMLGHPSHGLVQASCKKCGKSRTYSEDLSAKTWARRTTRSQGGSSAKAARSA